jgi:ATP phosphoribosyltransferase
MNDNYLKIAIQKSGRLYQGSVDTLRACGIDFGNGLGRLRSKALNFPLEILLLRDDDIPSYVDDRVADAGIVGENVLLEHGSTADTILKLGFGRCRLSVAVPRTWQNDDLEQLNGKKIATSYPNILGRFLERNKLESEIHTISGSVEIAPSIGLADAVCDLVSSGSTLFQNGLREVKTILDSEAVLIAREDLSDAKRETLEKLVFRIEAHRAGTENKYILLNAPNSRLEEILKLIPGMRSPSVLPLADSEWSSVHSVVGNRDYWTLVEQLKEAGAEGVLVLSIDQIIR